jgi:hypothetical protein
VDERRAVVAHFHGMLDVAINSPVADSMQTIMGALVTLWGLAALVALKRRQAWSPSEGVP